jgi:hypothetical protein
MKARTAMREQRDLEDLLKQEKSSPLESETSSDTDGDIDVDKSSIPMGNQDDVSLSTEAELSILEKRKIELTRSKQNMPKLDAVEEAVAIEDDSEHLGDSYRCSNAKGLNSSLKSSMKKSIRRVGSSDELKSSMKRSIRRAGSSGELKSSMKRSIRRGGLSNSPHSSIKAPLSGSMKKSIRRGGSSDVLENSDRSQNERRIAKEQHERRIAKEQNERRAAKQRMAYSKSQPLTRASDTHRNEPIRSSDNALT